MNKPFFFIIAICFLLLSVSASPSRRLDTTTTDNNATNTTSDNTTNNTSENTTNTTVDNTTNNTSENTTNTTVDNTTNNTSENNTNNNTENNTNNNTENNTNNNTENNTNNNTENNTNNNTENNTNNNTENNTNNSTENNTNNNTNNNTDNNTNNNTDNNTNNNTNNNSSNDTTPNYTCYNPLLQSPQNPAGIPGLQVPVQSSNLTYCPMLKDQMICCAETVINNLTGIYATLRANLTNMIKDIDANISATKDSLDVIVKSLKTMIKIEKDMLDKAKKVSGGSFDPSTIFNFSSSSGSNSWNSGSNSWNFNDSSFDDFNWNNRNNNKNNNSRNWDNDFSDWNNTFTNWTTDWSNRNTRMLASLMGSGSSNPFNAFNVPSPFTIYYNRTKEVKWNKLNFSQPDTVTQLMDDFASNFKQNFIKYQKGRKSCFEHLLKRFTKFVCMACSSTPSLFYKNSKLFLKKDFCTSTMSKCYDYLSLNELFSGFTDPTIYNLMANLTSSMTSMVQKVQTLINNLMNNPTDATALANLMQEISSIESFAKSSAGFGQMANMKFKMHKVPQTCGNSTDCQYICDYFIDLHGLDMSVLINPGSQLNSNLNRLLQDASVGVVYDDNGYNVENVTSGAETQVSFSQDPANTDNNFNDSNSAIGWIFNKTAMVLGLLGLALAALL